MLSTPPSLFLSKLTYLHSRCASASVIQDILEILDKEVFEEERATRLDSVRVVNPVQVTRITHWSSLEWLQQQKTNTN